MKTKIKITVLVENCVAFPFSPGNLQGMLGEHGIAVLIDNGEENLLYDTGRGLALLSNLERSGYKPEDIGKVVLSHGHIDHTGSLLPFLKTRKTTAVYCHPGIFRRKYGKRGSEMNYIGNPFTKSDLEAAGAVLNFTTEFKTIGSRISVSGQIPRLHRWEQNEGNFFVEEGETFVPDSFDDDQALFVNGDDGLVIITGCGHAGIINTVEHAARSFVNQKIIAVMGGLHLVGASSERLSLTIKYLRKFGVEKLIVGHCTGFEAMCQLREEFKDGLIPLNSGMQILF